MSHIDILAYWGDRALVRWPNAIVSKGAVSPATAGFLSDVGLPRASDWTLRFDLTEDEMQRAISHPDYVLIGYDDEVPLGIDRRQDIVVAHDPRGILRLVNSDVRRFGECLVVYHRYRMSVRQLDDEQQADELSARTEQAMRACDQKAFQHSESWWPLITEQMRDGLL